MAAPDAPGATRWQPAGHPPDRTERPHPLTPFVRGWVIFAALLIPVSQELLPGRGGGLPPVRWIVVAIAAVALVGGLAAFVTWRFTRFVIDDREVRIETGWLTTSSKKVPFERVQSIDVTQPLLARLFGLAELTIHAGGTDADLHLRYLSRPRALQLRDHLLARSHGAAAPVAVPSEDRITGVGASDDVLIRLTPRALLVGFVTSSDFIAWLVVVLLVGAGLVVSTVTRGALGFVVVSPIVLPLVLGIANLAMRYVVRQVNYTMVRTRAHDGVRVTAGLTSLTSRTIPRDRVQGFKIHQGLLWRWLGLYRIEVDVIGGTGEAETATQGNTLLPIGTGEQVATALAVLLPGADLRPALWASPGRCRWLRPFDHWTLRHGFTDDVIVTDQGWIHRRRLIVPHAKTQSVKIRRGPLQRALRLASVQVHNVDGPVDLQVRHIDPAWARELAFGQLERARQARRHPDGPQHRGE